MTRQEPRWVPRLVIGAVHLDQVREHGGLIGIRDENALDSGLARAKQRWTFDPDADLSRLAAGYVFGICTGHPFRDGNKRISFLAAVIFLGLPPNLPLRRAASSPAAVLSRTKSRSNCAMLAMM